MVLDPNFDIWHQMAYSVAKELHLRPSDVLMNWGCEELLVAFGFYMNQHASESYQEYKSLDASTKAKVNPKPKEYVVKFVDFEELDALNKPKTQEQIETEQKEALLMEAFMKGGGKFA